MEDFAATDDAVEFGKFSRLEFQDEDIAEDWVHLLNDDAGVSDGDISAQAIDSMAQGMYEHKPQKYHLPGTDLSYHLTVTVGPRRFQPSHLLGRLGDIHLCVSKTEVVAWVMTREEGTEGDSNLRWMRAFSGDEHPSQVGFWLWIPDVGATLARWI